MNKDYDLIYRRLYQIKLILAASIKVFKDDKKGWLGKTIQKCKDGMMSRLVNW